VSQLQWLKSADGRLTCGTPGCIAPELFMGGKASPQSDMFSFGVTLWQLAARSLASPYEVTFGGDPIKYQRAILKKAHDHAVRRVDSPYFEVIRRCLAPVPARRYPDFPALREAIKSAAKAAGVGAMDVVVAPGFRGSFEEYVLAKAVRIDEGYARSWYLKAQVKHLGRTADAAASARRATANISDLDTHEREGLRALLGQ
jgi:hypothetical protein